jgi:hypothetical protein
MGINLVPEIYNMSIRTAHFQRKDSTNTPPSGVRLIKNGSVEEACITEGTHKLLVFATDVHNRGNEDLKIGNPEKRDDIFEPANHMPYGYRMKKEFYIFTLKDNEGNTLAQSFKRPYCIRDHSTFTCDNQGISIGDHDEYNIDQICQFIPIGNIEDGIYLLEVTVNPHQVFQEENYDDNTIIKRIRIRGDVVREITEELKIVEGSQVVLGVNSYGVNLIPTAGARYGTFDTVWEHSILDVRSTIVASVCEGNLLSTNRGDANMQVLNVIPQDNKVYFRIRIDWNRPLSYRIHAMIFNNF